MGKYWETLQKARLKDWPYQELKNVFDKDLTDFYSKAGYMGTNYHETKVKETNRNAAYHKIGFSISYVICMYFIGWLAIILFVLYIVHQVMTWKPA